MRNLTDRDRRSDRTAAPPNDRSRSSSAPDLPSAPSQVLLYVAENESCDAKTTFTAVLPAFPCAVFGTKGSRLQPHRDADDDERPCHPARDRFARPGVADLGQRAELGAGRADGGDDAGARRGPQARPAGRPASRRTRCNGAEFNGGWTVFVDANGNGLLDAGETIIRVQPAFHGDMRVTTSGGQTLLAFNGRGFLTPSAMVTFTVCSSLATKSYRIRVEPVGLTDVAEATGCP